MKIQKWATRSAIALIGFVSFVGGKPIVSQSLGKGIAVQSAGAGSVDDGDCDDVTQASPYIPVDSWIYPAAIRLYALGYIDQAYLGMRPWTRASLGHMLEEADDRIEDDDGVPGQSEAESIYNALEHEIETDDAGPCQQSRIDTRIESTYTVVRGISGTPLRDSFHLGSTIVNDYGRPYSNGFNNYTGASGYASAGRFLLYVRGEFQGAPSNAGYSSTLSNELANIDLTTFYFTPNCWQYGTPCTPLPISQQPGIPAGPVAAAVRGRFIEAYISAQYLNHIISFGKQDDWQGPGLGGAMSYSNNAENIYSFRINRIEPLEIPLLSRLTGPFRYEFLVGPLKGHTYPIDPWIHVEKVSFRPTENLEFGFERSVIWGGKGHAPINVASFLRSFISFSSPTVNVKNSPRDPGARFGAFDFSYKLPFLRNWVTLYSDSEVHDDVSPIDAPRRASWRPGIYLSHVPGFPKLDLRLEAVSTDPPVRTSNGGRFMYWEVFQRQGYTNSGQMLGDWNGREAKGGQGWITYHLSGNEWIQLALRNQKAAKDFIPGGTTINDIDFQVLKRIGKSLEINGGFEFEHWKAPTYLTGTRTVTSTTIQLVWHPQK